MRRKTGQGALISLESGACYYSQYEHERSADGCACRGARGVPFHANLRIDHPPKKRCNKRREEFESVIDTTLLKEVIGSTWSAILPKVIEHSLPSITRVSAVSTTTNPVSGVRGVRLMGHGGTCTNTNPEKAHSCRARLHAD